MSHVMTPVVECINFIRARGLNHRQFRMYFKEVEAEYREMLYHTEVRFLSRGRVLIRFFELLSAVELFLVERGKHVPQLSDPEWVADLAFCCDLNVHLNTLNLRLQGRNILIIDMSDNIVAFKSKLQVWRNQLGEKDFIQFPHLN